MVAVCASRSSVKFHRLEEPEHQPRTHTEIHGIAAEDTPLAPVVHLSVVVRTRQLIPANDFLWRIFPCSSVSVRGSFQHLALNHLPECWRITDD